MSFKWIDIYVLGVRDHCNSKDIFEIYDVFGIQIKKVNKDDFILQGNESVYIRDYFGVEIVFIRDDLNYNFMKFLLAHELAHALLHTDLSKAAYNKSLVNRGKLEKQADYFAFKLLDMRLDSVVCQGYSKAQIASELCVREDCLDCMYLGEEEDYVYN